MEDKIILNEAKRMKELESYFILDTDPEQAYDDITRLAAEICETPIALVSLIDGDRQWFKSKIGMETDEMPRVVAFCSHAILQPNEFFLVENAPADARFADNPLVTDEPHIRFYAGAPLTTPSGEALGTLCVIDVEPRKLTDRQKLSLRVLARQVVTQLELRRTILRMQKVEAEQRETQKTLRENENRFQAFMNNNPAVAYMKDEAGRLVFVNKVFERLFNLEASELLGKTDFDYLPAEVATAVRKNDALVLSEWKPHELLENVPSADGLASHWISLKFPFMDANGAKFVGGVSMDITARTIAEENLNKSERRYRHLFELSPGFINVHGLDGVITSVNKAAADALGYESDEIIGKNLGDFLIPAARPFFPDYLERLSRTLCDNGVMSIINKNGEVRLWKYSNRVYEEHVAPPVVIGYAQDITDLQKAQEELRGLSLTDDLTGLYNRRGFFALAEQALRYARRTEKQNCLIYADLDGLKKVNDSFGHDIGSAMIVDAANVFKASFRESDIAARLGGDEFVFLVQDSSEAGTGVIRERLQKAVEEFNRTNTRVYTLSISFGVLNFNSNNPATLEELISEADKLMYFQKQAKKTETENPSSSPAKRAVPDGV